MALRDRSPKKWKKLSDLVWAKTDGVCWYCGTQTVRASSFCVDHLQPQRHGGTDDLSNLVPSGRSCNSSKRERSLCEWQEHLAWRSGERFTEEQELYLRMCGIELPQPPVRLFHFEKMGWKR